MDDKDLFRLLGKSHYTTDAQLRVLEEGVKDAFFKMSLLCNESPQNHAVLEARNALQQAMQAARVHHLTDVAIMTGNGPVASKLKEFLNLQRWFQSSNTSIALSIAERKIQQFDFNPLVEGEECVKLFYALQEISQALEVSAFDKAMITPYWPQDPYELARMEPGVYAFNTTHDTGLYRALLRVTSPTGVVTMVACQQELTEVYFFHPLEEMWVKRNTGMSFPGLADALSAEFEKHKQVAHLVQPNEVDFAADLQELQRKAQEIFAHMEVLPTVVGDTGASSSSFSRSFFGKETPEYAFIQSRSLTSPIFLCFVHARSDDKGRDCGYFLHANPGVIKIEPAAVPDAVKRELHRGASDRMEQLQQLIKSIQTGDLQLSPFAYLIPPVYYDKSQLQ